MNHTYLRGDMYYADLGRGIGSEQEGYDSAHRYAGDHRRQEQDHSKGQDKDKGQLSQPAACAAI